MKKRTLFVAAAALLAFGLRAVPISKPAVIPMKVRCIKCVWTGFG